MHLTTSTLLLPFLLLLSRIAICAPTSDDTSAEIDHLVSNRLSPVSLHNLVNKDRLHPPVDTTKKRATSALSGPLYIELPLDHTDSNSETFYNRYWVDETFYQPGGPVFCKCSSTRSGGWTSGRGEGANDWVGGLIYSYR